MNRRRLILSLVGAAIVIAAIVAAVMWPRADAPATDDAEVVLHDDVTVIEDPAEITSYDPDSGELALATPPAVGDVLVAGVTPATPEGLLVRVESVAADGTVATSPAKLTDAIEDTGGPITLEGVAVSVEVEPASGVTYRPNVTGGGGAGTFSPLWEGELAHGLDLDIPLFEEDGEALAHLTGSVDAGVNATLDLDVGLIAGLRHIEATLNPKIQSELSVDSSQEWSGSRTKKIGEVNHRWLFMAGPLPVIITSSLVLNADVEASVSAQLNVTTGASADLLVGYRHNEEDTANNGPIFEQTSNLDSPALTGAVAADVGASIAATIQAKFYGVLGIHGTAGPYAELAATLDLREGLSCTWGGGLRGEVGASVGIERLGPDAYHEWTTDGTWPWKEDQACPGFQSLDPIDLATETISDNWTVGEDITPTTATAAGGNAETMTFTLRGDIPPGVALRADGAGAVLSGTPTRAGTYTFTLVAADGSGLEDTTEVTVTVTDPLPPPPPLEHISSDAIGAVVGYPWGIPLYFTGGRGPYTFEAQNLPAGMELLTDLDPTPEGWVQAAIAGTFQQAGDWTSQVTVRDSSGQSLTIDVGLGAIEPPDPLPPGFEEMYPSP